MQENGAKTLSIMTLSIMTLSTRGLDGTLSIVTINTQDNNALPLS